MKPALDPLAEERAAAKQARILAKATRAAARSRQADYAERVRVAARDQRSKHPTCKCDFTGVRDRAGLLAMGAGCTDPRYTCPRLDAVRRALGL